MASVERADVILRLPHGGDTEASEKALRQAFAGYLFETPIVTEMDLKVAELFSATQAG